MTTQPGEPIDHDPWRRPDSPPPPRDSPIAGGGDGQVDSSRSGAPGTPLDAGYAGPPTAPPPPPGWRPPMVIRPAPPRTLPGQDTPVLDAEEHNARTLTLGIAMVAGALAIIVMCLLGARLLF